MTCQRAHLIVLLAAALWGLGNVAQKTILEHMGPLMATALTLALGAFALAPLMRLECPAAHVEKGVPGPSGREIIFGALMFGASVATMQIGYGGTSVSNAGFLVNTCTVITPLAAWAILSERPSAAVLPSILLVLGGVWLMGGASLTALAWGDGFCLLAAVLFAFSISLNSRLVLRYGRPSRMTVVQFLISAALCFAMALIFEHNSIGSIIMAWPELLMMGLISKALPYFLMAFAQQHTSATATAIIASAEGIFGACSAAYFLGETMPGMAIAGASLIMLSVVFLQILPQRWIDTRRPRYVAAMVRVDGATKFAADRKKTY